MKMNFHSPGWGVSVSRPISVSTESVKHQKENVPHIVGPEP